MWTLMRRALLLCGVLVLVSVHADRAYAGEDCPWDEHTWSGGGQYPQVAEQLNIARAATPKSGLCVAAVDGGLLLAYEADDDNVLPWPMEAGRCPAGYYPASSKEIDYAADPPDPRDLNGDSVLCARGFVHAPLGPDSKLDLDIRDNRCGALCDPPPTSWTRGFKTEVSGWNTSGSGSAVTLTRIANPPTAPASWSGQLNNTGSTPAWCGLNDSPNLVKSVYSGTNGRYYFGVYVRGPAAGAPLRARVREYSAGVLVGSATRPVTLTTDWQYVDLMYQPVVPGNSTLDFNVYIPDAPPGICFDAAGASATLGPATSPYHFRNLFPTDDRTGEWGDLWRWNTSGSGPNISLTTGARTVEAGSFVLHNTGTSASTCTLNDSPDTVAITKPGTYTATISFRNPTPGRTLKLRLREYRHGALIGSASSPLTLTTDYQAATVSYTPLAPGESSLDVNAYVSDAPPGACFDAADGRLELQPAAD